ncbi:hypothetical protein EVAR_100361_1 [Eumeta japonica]|uniref:Uncharacterized protein n=1 Tax=Eumeta variegata TaxID=151549 RepID=A0A4C2A4C5_EUMVA|nr:hypothetical protein EVAR_100361_1 [Eumeta japonica]
MPIPVIVRRVPAPPPRPAPMLTQGRNAEANATSTGSQTARTRAGRAKEETYQNTGFLKTVIYFLIVLAIFRWLGRGVCLASRLVRVDTAAPACGAGVAGTCAPSLCTVVIILHRQRSDSFCQRRADATAVHCGFAQAFSPLRETKSVRFKLICIFYNCGPTVDNNPDRLYRPVYLRRFSRVNVDNLGERDADAAPTPPPSGCVRLLSLFYSDAPADGVEERSLVPRSRSLARLRRNATLSHAFSCVQPAFIDL